MVKGIIILLVVFIIVGIIHFISMKTMNLSETKKSHCRKIFWYFYGSFLIISGGVNLINDFHWSFIIELLIGLIIMVALNFLGKFQSKSS